MHLVTGYKTRKKDAEPTVLYCGNDRGKALGILDAKPKDSSIIRVEFRSPHRRLRKKVYEPSAKVETKKFKAK